MKFLNLIIILFSVQAAAVTTVNMDAVSLKDKDLRLKICDKLVYDYFDAGEFFNMDEDGKDIAVFCDDSSIYLTSKVMDKFPKGQTPQGFEDEIVTKYNFTAELTDDFGSCYGSAIKVLPRVGFRVTQEGAIKSDSRESSYWNIYIEKCD